MKKMIITVFTLVIAASMSASVFAASPIESTTEPDNTDEKGVQATYNASREDTYSVAVSWGSMEFTYTPEKYVWDAEKKQYDTGKNGTWSCNTDENKVTVTNNSNAKVNVDIAYSVKNKDISGLLKTTNSIDGTNYSTKTLESAFLRPNGADSTSAYLFLSGTLDGNAENLAKGEQIGTLIVKITG